MVGCATGDGTDCVPTTFGYCWDGLDNDCDGLSDCNDPDCFGVGECELGSDSDTVLSKVINNTGAWSPEPLAWDFDPVDGFYG